MSDPEILRGLFYTWLIWGMFTFLLSGTLPLRSHYRVRDIIAQLLVSYGIAFVIVAGLGSIIIGLKITLQEMGY